MHTVRRLQLRIIAISLALVVVCVAFFVHLHAGTNTLIENPGGYSSIGDYGLLPGQVFDFGIQFKNVSPDQTIILRPVSLPRGLPAHVRLLHEGVLTAAEGSVLGDHGWPPTDLTAAHHPVHTLDGFRLPPNTEATILLALQTDAPGAYIIGPVTVHADSALFGVDLAGFPMQMTYTQFAVLCPQVGKGACDAAQDHIRSLLAAQ